MSKILYIHKPSLTAVVQYNPQPDVEKIATVDILEVIQDVLDGIPQSRNSQPQAVLAYFIIILMKKLGVTVSDGHAPEAAEWFINNQKQALYEEGVSL